MPNQPIDSLDETLSQAQASLREEVAKLLSERFAGLESRLREEFDRQLERRSEEFAGEIVRLAGAQCRNVRRISRSESRPEWVSALLDAASDVAASSALFSVGDGRITFEGARNVAAPPPADLSVPLSAAPAFTAAVASEDVVLTVATASELSPEIASLFRSGDAERVQLFPVLARRTCVAVLCAQLPAGVEPFLESLAVVAGLAFPAPVAEPAPLLPVLPPETRQPAVQAPSSVPEGMLDWESLPPPERERHRNAQRFSRVQVAEIRLYKAPAVRSGRAAGSLYEALQQEIDANREVYRRQFLSDSPIAVDYLHQELVRTLANGEARLLGTAYPGPLV